MKQEGIPFILSAPSGTGKTTVCKILRERMPDLKFSVSHTTRPSRPSETDGGDYYFISEQEFKTRIERGDFLEWAKVHKSYYGTALETINNIKKDGNDILLELDVQGVQSLRKLDFAGVFIFLLPPSIEELGNRLRKRHTEPEDKILQRIEVGKEEINKYKIYDYVVTNCDVEKTVNTILSIIRAEKCRSNLYLPTSKDIETALKQGMDD